MEAVLGKDAPESSRALLFTEPGDFRARPDSPFQQQRYTLPSGSKNRLLLLTASSDLVRKVPYAVVIHTCRKACTAQNTCILRSDIGLHWDKLLEFDMLKCSSIRMI